MAIYHCTTKPISRSKGRSAVAAAAYRAGQRIEDQRTGITHDYTQRQGVDMTITFLLDGEVCDRSQLWNAAELAEKRKDARTAREWVIALPAELNADQRAMLATDFACELSHRYGVGVDLAVHAPDKAGDQRNHHAHILTTTRKVTRREGELVLGDKATLELSDKKRAELQLGKAKLEVKNIRAMWADRANEHLARAGHEVRIDHRTLQEQGIDKVASIHLGPVATEMERNGKASERGAFNRASQLLEAEIIDLKTRRERKNKQARQQWIQHHPEQVRDEYQQRYGAIRAQIGQRAETIDNRLDAGINRLRQQHYQHLQAEPPAPKGLLKRFRKAPYEQWLRKKQRMEKRLEQLRQRRELIRDYKADGELTMYRHRGNALADQKMKARFPQLARERDIADREITRQREIQLQQRELERQRNRQRYRGLGR